MKDELELNHHHQLLYLIEHLPDSIALEIDRTSS